MNSAATITDQQIDNLRRRIPHAFGRPLPARLGSAALWTAFVAMVFFALWRCIIVTRVGDKRLELSGDDDADFKRRFELMPCAAWGTFLHA